MTNTFLSIAPIFLVIILGLALRRAEIVNSEFWDQADRFVYWVLLPCLLFHKIAIMDLSGAPFASLALVAYSGYGAAFVFALLAGMALSLTNPTRTSLIQGCGRQNFFIALAVSLRLYGAEGLAIAALIGALLIPAINVVVVTLLVLMLRTAGPGHIRQIIFKELVRNPLLISIVLGAGFNLLGGREIPIIYDVTAMLGAAGLPLVLLCIGANIRLTEMAATAVPTLMSIVGKMIVCPLAIGVTAVALGLDLQTTFILLVFGAVPTAASSYTLARQFGGDAPAMASMIMVQTALSFVTLPLTLTLAQYVLGSP